MRPRCPRPPWRTRCRPQSPPRARPRRRSTASNTPALFATINAVKGAPALAAFRFRARNRWIDGTCSESTIEPFDGAGGEHTHTRRPSPTDADHPAVLVGADRGPTPVEFLLHALASCITRRHRQHRRRPRRHAARRSSRRSKATSTCRASSASPTRSATATSSIRVQFAIAGDAPRPRSCDGIVEQARARSAVYDVLTNGVPVDISVATGVGAPCHEPTRRSSAADRRGSR